jgi:hypothetical protein
VIREDYLLIVQGRASIVTWVECMTEILEVVILLIELGGVYMNFLNHSCQVILLCDQLIGRLEASQLF